MFVFAGFLANAQTSSDENDSVEVKIIKLPDSTAIATPTGKKLSKEIGVGGGKIVSDDGKLELIFPANALDKTTEISIQPVDPSIPNGNKGYHFEPSGIRFKKPVGIIFHYSAAEAAVCPPDLKFMALQDDKGKWEYMPYNEWDSATNSLKGTISHFSVLVDGNVVELSDTEIKLRVGQTHPLALNIVQPPTAPAAPGEDELPPLPSTINRNGRQVLWKVNGSIGGTVKHGRVSALNGQAIRANYKAPEKLTSDSINITLDLNNITIREVVQRSGRWRGTTRVPTTTPLASFSCKVTLYEEYKVTVFQHIKVDGGEMSDTSVFRLKVEIKERVSISDISNQMAKVHIRQGRCRAEYVNAATCVGMINVTGLKTSNLAFMPDGSVRVDVFFKPAPFIFPVIHFPPCGGNRASNTTPPAIGNTAFPMWLNFEAKNEKQYVSLGKGAGSVVRRPDPEDITATIEPIRD